MNYQKDGKWRRRIWEGAKLILGFLLGMSVTIGVYYSYGSPLFTITTTTVGTVTTYTTTSVSTATTISTVTQIQVQNPPPLGNFSIMGTVNSTGWGTSATQVEFRPPSGSTTFAKVINGHYSASLFANTLYRVYLDSNFWIFGSTSFCFVLETQVTAGSQPLIMNWKC